MSADRSRERETPASSAAAPEPGAGVPSGAQGAKLLMEMFGRVFDYGAARGAIQTKTQNIIEKTKDKTVIPEELRPFMPRIDWWKR